MQANSWHHKLFYFHLYFESGKFGKEGKKIQKFEYLENGKSFLDEIKNIFHSFVTAIIWWKNKSLIKNSDKSFNYTIMNKMSCPLLIKVKRELFLDKINSLKQFSASELHRSS